MPGPPRRTVSNYFTLSGEPVCRRNDRPRLASAAGGAVRAGGRRIVAAQAAAAAAILKPLAPPGAYRAAPKLDAAVIENLPATAYRERFFRTLRFHAHLEAPARYRRRVCRNSPMPPIIHPNIPKVKCFFHRKRDTGVSLRVRKPSPRSVDTASVCRDR